MLANPNAKTSKVGLLSRPTDLCTRTLVDYAHNWHLTLKTQFSAFPLQTSPTAAHLFLSLPILTVANGPSYILVLKEKTRALPLIFTSLCVNHLAIPLNTFISTTNTQYNH